MSNGKGPKVKPRGGETRLKISKNKRKGVELSTGLGSSALSGLARAITKKLD